MKVVVLAGLLIFQFLIIVCQSTKKPTHWTDFVPKKGASQTKGKALKPISRASHKTLNAKSKTTNPIREDYIRSEIKLGHTGRKDFIPLLNDRDHHESNVNNAMIGGIVLRKLDKYKQSKSLFEYAHEQRTKSQNIQKQMNHIKKAGNIGRIAKHKDWNELSRAKFNYRYDNDPEFREKYRAKMKRAKERRMRLDLVKKGKRTSIPDLNRSPSHGD